MKRLTSILLLFVLICSFSSCNAEHAPVLNDTPSEGSDKHISSNDTSSKVSETTYPDWQTAYLDFIETREREYGRESDYGFDHRYALVYIDNDDIPELYAMGHCEADGDLICSYKNCRVIEQLLGRTLGGKYVERSGIVINQNGHTHRD